VAILTNLDEGRETLSSKVVRAHTKDVIKNNPTTICQNNTLPNALFMMGWKGYLLTKTMNSNCDNYCSDLNPKTKYLSDLTYQRTHHSD